MKRNASVIIFWGAIWGFVEATLGYVLHSFSLSVGWFFWFPLAFYFMNRVYRQTNSLTSILSTSVIAASVKLVDFLLPSRIDRIINPAVSIILEGLVVFAAFKMVQHKQDLFKFRYLEALAVSVGWRALYIVYILLMPVSYFNISPLRAVNPFLKFFLLESITNSFIIYVCIKIAERISKRKAESEHVKDKISKRILVLLDTNTVFRTSLSLSMLALALYAQWVLEIGWH